MNREDIIAKLQSQLPVLREKYHVKEIGLFGSVARGEGKADSDIDIVVAFSAPIGFFDFIRLEKFLGELLGRSIDLVSRRAVKPAVREDILREVIYI